jgi:hypothetical protein
MNQNNSKQGQMPQEKGTNPYYQVDTSSGASPRSKKSKKNPYYDVNSMNNNSNNKNTNDMNFNNMNTNNMNTGMMGQINPPSNNPSLFDSFDTSNFLKGAALGAIGAYLLTNEDAQKTIFKTFAKGTEMFQAGIEEMKERFEDAKAEMDAER